MQVEFFALNVIWSVPSIIVFGDASLDLALGRNFFCEIRLELEKIFNRVLRGDVFEIAKTQNQRAFSQESLISHRCVQYQCVHVEGDAMDNT